MLIVIATIGLWLFLWSLVFLGEFLDILDSLIDDLIYTIRGDK